MRAFPASIVLLTLTTLSEAGKVLVYSPSCGYQHAALMGKMADLMAMDGHDVTTLFSVVNPNVTDPSTKMSKVITVPVSPETAAVMERGESDPKGLIQFFSATGSPMDLITGFFWRSSNFSYMFAEQCREASSEQYMSQLRGQSFDFGVTELYDLCGLGIFHMLGMKKVVLVSSMPLHSYYATRLGLPEFDSIVPGKCLMKTSSGWMSGYGREAPFRDRMENYLSNYGSGREMFGWLNTLEGEVFKAKDSAFPPFEVLMRRAQLLFLNYHPLLDLPVPTLPAIIPIGGLMLAPPKAVSKEVEEYLSRRKYTVFVSFGTVFKSNTIPFATKKNLIAAFAAIPEATFIWKYDDSKLPEGIEKPDNVVLVKWTAQNDLLANRKLSLFVSHMGIASFTEASYRGVPMVALPIFVDQPYNTIAAIRLGTARYVNKEDLFQSPDTLIEAIKGQLTDDKSKKAARQLAASLAVYSNQTDVFLSKIRYISSLPHDAPSKSFENPSVYLSTIALYNLDFYLALVLSLPVFLAFFLVVVGVPTALFLYSAISDILRRRREELTVSAPSGGQGTQPLLISLHKCSSESCEEYEEELIDVVGLEEMEGNEEREEMGEEQAEETGEEGEEEEEELQRDEPIEAFEARDKESSEKEGSESGVDTASEAALDTPREGSALGGRGEGDEEREGGDEGDEGEERGEGQDGQEELEDMDISVEATAYVPEVKEKEVKMETEANEPAPPAQAEPIESTAEERRPLLEEVQQPSTSWQ